MVKNCAVVLVFLFSISISAQEFQGKAEYFSKIIRKPKPSSTEIKSDEDAEMKKLVQEALKKATENSYLLTFNKQECLYEKKQELEKPQAKEDEFTLSISLTTEGQKYINLKDKFSVIEDDIYQKDFLRVDSLSNFNWRLIDETKKIGDYNCFKAEVIIPVSDKEKDAYTEFLKRKEKGKTSGLFDISEPKDKVVTAWYAPEIPVSFGPDNYWGLPGLILEIDEEQKIILCSKITLSNKNIIKIKPPNNGKKVTTKEFDVIRKKKTDSLKNKDGNVIFQTTE